MMTTRRSRPAHSLRERILQAQTLHEITKLLRDGAQFLKAIDRTRSQWHKAAAQRTRELNEGSAR